MDAVQPRFSKTRRNVTGVKCPKKLEVREGVSKKWGVGNIL